MSNVRLNVGSTVKDKERNRNDFYPTPYAITEDLFSVETFIGDVLEPACGEGDMVKIIEKYNKVTAFDKFDDTFILEMQDFLELDESKKYDNIITNPPYSAALEFVKKSKKIANRKIAMILRIQFLEGVKRYNEIFSDKEFPLAKVYVYSGRVGFGNVNTKKTPSALCFAWFVWDKDWEGEPVIRWLQ